MARNTWQTCLVTKIKAQDQNWPSVMAAVAALPDPAMRESFVTKWELNGETVDTEICDTPGHDSADVRKQILPSSNVVVVAFSMIDKTSLQSVACLSTEVKATLGAEFDSFILVGTKHDEWVKQHYNCAECVTEEDCYQVRLLPPPSYTLLSPSPSTAIVLLFALLMLSGGADGARPQGERFGLHRN